MNDIEQKLKNYEAYMESRECVFRTVLLALREINKEEHRQYIYNNATMVKYLMAASDNEGEIRSAILEQAKAWIESGKPATLKDVLSPVTVA